jgi:hypothetical protein
MIIDAYQPPNTINVSESKERGPLGRFRPREIRDQFGRLLIIIDLLEVERRLKARRVENDD